MDKGKIAYYIKQESNRRYVSFGIVLEWSDYHKPILQILEPKDLTTINGILKKDFKTPNQWKKLPKGWKYDTKLFDLDVTSPEELKEIKISNPEDILRAYHEGWLVKPSDNDHSTIEIEIKEKSWRIVRKIGKEYIQNIISLPSYEIFATYQEAQSEIDKIEAELKRQSELSDYDWVVEHIDEVLGFWKYRYGKTGEEVANVRKRLLEFDNVENLDIRCFSENIQWKYLKNKRWNTLV